MMEMSSTIGATKAHAARLGPGTDLVPALLRIAREAQAKSKSSACCVLTAVGSLSEVTLRMANASRSPNGEETNEIKTWKECVEIVSLVGTFSSDGGKHLHMAVSRQDGSMIGGHVMSGKVFTTLEIVLGTMPGVVFTREVDSQTGYRELIVRQPPSTASFFVNRMGGVKHLFALMVLLSLAFFTKLPRFTTNVQAFGFQTPRPLRPLYPLLSAIKGDPLRASTGIRPSLHPLTINAISTVLQKSIKENSNLRVDQEGVEALQVAISAGKIAAEAIQNRQEQSKEDDMLLTPEEGQTIAGRVVGVTMRLAQLEQLLQERCKAASWIAKYNEWSSFGVLENEASVDSVNAQIQRDPLFVMNRAECLLALFLDTVEKPELQMKGANVPDNSCIDFLDTDRFEVLVRKSE